MRWKEDTVCLCTVKAISIFGLDWHPCWSTLPTDTSCVGTCWTLSPPTRRPGSYREYINHTSFHFTRCNIFPAIWHVVCCLSVALASASNATLLSSSRFPVCSVCPFLIRGDRDPDCVRLKCCQSIIDYFCTGVGIGGSIVFGANLKQFFFVQFWNIVSLIERRWSEKRALQRKSLTKCTDSVAYDAAMVLAVFFKASQSACFIFSPINNRPTIRNPTVLCTSFDNHLNV